MRQPSHTFDVFSEEDNNCKMTYWLDIVSEDGGFCNVGIGKGRTKLAAIKAAINRMGKLIKKLEKLQAKEE